VETVEAKEKWIAVVRDLVPMGAIIFLVLGLIFLGVATPTEAAALGALGAFLLAAVFRSLTPTVIKRAIVGSLKVTVMILAIIAGSGAFSQVLAFSGASRQLVQLVLSADISPMLILLIMLSAVVILGFFMEQVSIMMITIPVFMPIVAVLGFDPIWFAVLVLICLEIGQLTPPVGLALFVMKGVAPPSISMGQIYKAALPYVAADVVGVALIIVFPAIALWLPGFI
jgi:tripartite ATP-independent transporter DctM subunit